MQVFIQNNGVLAVTGCKPLVYSGNIKLSYIVYADTVNSIVRAIVPDALYKKYEGVIKQVDPEYKKVKLTEHKDCHWFEFKVPDLKVVFE